jgi:photosystem II stability/assembly factor-like uncharacterized protein
MGRKFGFSFSWRCTLGNPAAKAKLWQQIGIPLTRSGLAVWMSAAGLCIAARADAGEQPSPPGLAQPWFSLGPTNLSGRLQAIAFDPTDANTIYVGAAGGGVWKSANGGRAWRPLGDNLPSLTVSAIAVDPRDPRIVVIGTGDPVIGNDWIHGAGILRSRDGGATWDQTNVTDDSYSRRNGYHAIEINRVSGVVLAASVDGLLRSADDGATWTQVESGGNWTDVKWRPGSADTAIAVRESGGLYLSSDSGHTFTHLTVDLPPDSSIAALSKVAISEANPDCIYAGLSSPALHHLLGIYRSLDGGATWSLQANSPDLYSNWGDYGNVLLVDPSNPDHVIAGAFQLFHSENGGVTWQTLADGTWEAFHGIAYSPSAAPSLWVATDRGVYEFPAQGGAWLDRNQGLVTLQAYDVCFSKTSRSVGYVGSQDRGALAYYGSPTWRVGVDGVATLCNCDPRDPLHVYGEFPFGYHFVSHDGLATWTPINEGLEGLGRYLTPVDMDPSDPERLFSATSAGIFSTTNGGEAWGRAGDAEDVVSISVSPVTGNWVWALERSSGIVRRSNDGGSSWTALQAAPTGPIGGTKILADPADSMTAFATFLLHPLARPVVLRTRDGGLTWQDVSGNLQGQSVNTIAIDPSRPSDWFVGTKAGVWYSGSAGATWVPYGSGLPHAVVMDLDIQDISRKLRVATNGRGVWETALAGTTSSAKADGGSLFLERSSSNPTRGVAAFRYAGRGTGQLQLRIYDMAGRLVARFAEDPADGLVRTAQWDSRLVAAGVYLAVLRSGRAVVSTKVVSVR